MLLQQFCPEGLNLKMLPTQSGQPVELEGNTIHWIGWPAKAVRHKLILMEIWFSQIAEFITGLKQKVICSCKQTVVCLWLPKTQTSSSCNRNFTMELLASHSCRLLSTSNKLSRLRGLHPVTWTCSKCKGEDNNCLRYKLSKCKGNKCSSFSPKCRTCKFLTRWMVKWTKCIKECKQSGWPSGWTTQPSMVSVICYQTIQQEYSLMTQPRLWLNKMVSVSITTNARQLHLQRSRTFFQYSTSVSTQKNFRRRLLFLNISGPTCSQAVLSNQLPTSLLSRTIGLRWRMEPMDWTSHHQVVCMSRSGCAQDMLSCSVSAIKLCRSTSKTPLKFYLILKIELWLMSTNEVRDLLCLWVKLWTATTKRWRNVWSTLRTFWLTC